MIISECEFLRIVSQIYLGAAGYLLHAESVYDERVSVEVERAVSGVIDATCSVD